FSAIFTTSVLDAQCSDDGASPVPGPSAHPSGIISDDFNRCDLASFWTVVDPVGDATTAASGVGSGDAALHVSVPAGRIHDPWTGNSAPRVLQPANDTDFTIAARFTSTFDQSIQGHGLRVEDDAGNFLRFDVFRNGTTTQDFVGDTSTFFANSAIGELAAPPGYLRIARSGVDWTMSYSSDGSTWTDVVTRTHTFPG